MTMTQAPISLSPGNARRYYVEWAWRCRHGGWSREVIRYLRAQARAFRGERA
jgi:hypothetical protein